MRNYCWKKVLILFVFIPFVLYSLTGCNTAANKAKPLRITKINATDYPNNVSAFFSLSEEYETLFNKDICNAPLEITNDGKEVTKYQLYSQRKDTIPNQTLLLIDNSYSMKTENAMEIVKKNLETFIQMMTINDEIMIVTFNTDINVVTINEKNEPIFISDKTKLFPVIDAITYEEKNTTLFDSLYNTLEIFNSFHDIENKNIVLFTDLAETSQYIHNNHTPEQCKDLAHSGNIKIYPIVYGCNIDCTFRDKIESLSTQSFYTDQFSEVRSFFYTISSNIYVEKDLYGITTFWVYPNKMKSSKKSLANELLENYLNHCISKDSNGLFVFPNNSLLPGNKQSTNDISELYKCLYSPTQYKLNDSINYFEEYQTLQVSLNESSTSSKSFIFFIDQPDKLLYNTLTKSIKYAIDNGISYNFIVIKDNPASIVKLFSHLALQTGGFINTIQGNVLTDKAVTSLVENIQGDYLVSFTPTPSNTIFQSHKLELELSNSPNTSDSKQYFSGFINTSFKNSPYYKIFVWFLLILLLALLVSFILLYINTKKKKVAKVINEDNDIFGVSFNEINNPNKTQLTDNDQKRLSNTTIIKSTPKGISWLTIVKGKQQGKSFTINQKSPTKIGRKITCEVSIQDETLSDHHATIYVKTIDGKYIYYIKDMVSTNNTLVNGIHIEGSIALHDNDSIQCGDLLFVYKTIGNSEALK